MKNSDDNVLRGIPVANGEASLAEGFLRGHDFAAHTRRAFASDLRKFAGWFTSTNKESFAIGRVTVRDVSDFRDHLRRQQGQAVSSVNRGLVTVRRFFAWLVDQGHLTANPAKLVKELRRQALAPKGMDRADVRKLLREVELRGDTEVERRLAKTSRVRAAAFFPRLRTTRGSGSGSEELNAYSERCCVGVALPFQSHFTAILLHRCYTDMQCHEKRTYADLT